MEYSSRAFDGRTRGPTMLREISACEVINNRLTE
jgi:hypothetical protein